MPCAPHCTPSTRPSISRKQGQRMDSRLRRGPPLRSTPRLTLKGSGALKRNVRGGMTEYVDGPAGSSLSTHGDSSREWYHDLDVGRIRRELQKGVQGLRRCLGERVLCTLLDGSIINP